MKFISYTSLRRLVGLSLLSSSLAVSLAVAQENEMTALERGKAAAAACVACHQADGSGMNNAGAESWPRLSGLSAGYIAKQLTDFQEGRRLNPSMEPFAKMLTKEQVPDVAEYYASLDVVSSESLEPTDDKILERGKQLALKGDWDNYIVACVSCHGPGNHGVGDDFPNISGQHPAYIVAQLQDWKMGKRENDPLGLMKNIAERMSDEDMQAVAAWLSQQPGMPVKNN